MYRDSEEAACGCTHHHTMHGATATATAEPSATARCTGLSTVHIAAHGSRILMSLILLQVGYCYAECILHLVVELSFAHCTTHAHLHGTKSDMHLLPV